MRRLVLAVLLSGCLRPDPLYCDDGARKCTDTSRPFCDLHGEYPASGNLDHICIPTPDGLSDAALTVDATTYDGLVRDAPPPDARPCTDAGSCPAETPICRLGACSPCVVASVECPTTAPVCEASGECGGCTAESECDARSTTPHCGPGGACVECRLSSDCAPPDRPVCEASTSQCRRCQANSECSSQVCADDTGRCIAEDTVLYVDQGVVASGATCTKAAPCKTIAEAIGKATGPRNWVSVAAGDYIEQVRVTTGTVTIAGAGPGVIINPDGVNKPVVLVDQGGALTLSRVTVQSGGGTAGVGIQCTGTVAPFPSIKVDRSTVTANGGGGIKVSDCDFTIRNSFIVSNGSGASPFGGLLIGSQPPTTGQISFTTIAANGAAVSSASGIICNNLAPFLEFSNNIVYGNTTATQVSGMCSFAYSDIGPSTVTGVGNINADPRFTSSGDFHILPSSSCKNAADPGATLMTDFDGQPRPQGGRPDIGADEVP